MARLEFDVGNRRLEQVTGDGASVLDDLFRRVQQCRPSRYHGPRPTRPSTSDQLIAVALQQIELVNRYAKYRSQDLGESDVMALTIVKRA